MPHPSEPPRQNLLTRRQRREDTILRKANKLYTEDGTEIYILIYHLDNGTYRGFTSQPDKEFPPSPEQLVQYRPVILDPATIGPFLHNQSSQAQQQQHYRHHHYHLPEQTVPSATAVVELAPPLVPQPPSYHVDHPGPEYVALSGSSHSFCRPSSPFTSYAKIPMPASASPGSTASSAATLPDAPSGTYLPGEPGSPTGSTTFPAIDALANVPSGTCLPGEPGSPTGSTTFLAIDALANVPRRTLIPGSSAPSRRRKPSRRGSARKASRRAGRGGCPEPRHPSSHMFGAE
ncbi:hypothetical protein F5Y09DRAFT_342416 [Xylaria sp. FL1042]|nr:hypothetical protein F5Y09DRAFT_342416 [Xylaria sp. FL1042]